MPKIKGFFMKRSANMRKKSLFGNFFSLSRPFFLFVFFSFTILQSDNAPKAASNKKPLLLSKPNVTSHGTTKHVEKKTDSTKSIKKGTTFHAGPETSDAETGTQGNWRKKKDWLKKTIEKNDSIQDAVADIQKFRNTFLNKFESIDLTLKNFYRETGFEEGKIASLFEEVAKEIEETKKKTKELFSSSLSQIDGQSKEEIEKIKSQYLDTYSIEEKFKGYQNNLSQLQLDTQSIIDLDKSIRERLNKADEKIQTMQKESQEAQELSKKIWFVIDDLKARDIFYKVKGIDDKTKVLQNYIKKDLTRDLDSVSTTIKQQIKKTNISIKNLENQGIVIKNRAEYLAKKEKAKRDKLEKQKKEASEQTRTKRKRKPKQASWFTEIWNTIKYIFGY